jgi:RNA polymerase sigma-70 factor (ECF subfamily)
MVTMAAVADGSQQLEALYRQDGDRLWRALFAFAGDPEVASDAVAEAFAQALRRGGAVNNPQAWVWKASFRIAAGELKKRGSTTSLMPDLGYVDQEVDTELLDSLAKLPDRQRAAVVLFYYADASVREVARRTGTSQLAVRANLSRGRKRLKQLLSDRDD